MLDCVGFSARFRLWLGYLMGFVAIEASHFKMHVYVRFSLVDRPTYEYSIS